MSAARLIANRQLDGADFFLRFFGCQLRRIHAVAEQMRPLQQHRAAKEDDTNAVDHQRCPNANESASAPIASEPNGVVPSIARLYRLITRPR